MRHDMEQHLFPRYGHGVAIGESKGDPVAGRRGGNGGSVILKPRIGFGHRELKLIQFGRGLSIRRGISVRASLQVRLENTVHAGDVIERADCRIGYRCPRLLLGGEVSL